MTKPQKQTELMRTYKVTICHGVIPDSVKQYETTTKTDAETILERYNNDETVSLASVLYTDGKTDVGIFLYLKGLSDCTFNFHGFN